MMPELTSCVGVTSSGRELEPYHKTFKPSHFLLAPKNWVWLDQIRLWYVEKEQIK